MDENAKPKQAEAIILAAGKGSRFDSGEPTPKVALSAAGKPMIRWVLDACREAGVSRCIVVVGYQGHIVRQELSDMTDVAFVEQPEQLGTGHAAQMAQPLFDDSHPTDVFVLAGDAPLVRPSTLTQLLSRHRSASASATVATAILEDPTGYGRIMRDDNGQFDAIVEHKDCTEQQRLVREINPSYYCFDSVELFNALSQVKNNNKQSEYYLTDVPGLLKQQGQTVAVVDAVPPEDVLGVNTPEQWQIVDDILGQRVKAVGDDGGPLPFRQQAG